MFELLKETYYNKKVFLTGHTGFKGAWMLKILAMLGAEVKGYSLATDHQDNIYNAITGDNLCDSVIGDLRNRLELTKQLVDFQPDFVFHLAAQPLVRLSYEIPSETFEVNAVGTANLLDAVRQLEKKCVIVLITTDKVYYNYEWIYPYRETDRLGGYDPYSASKACAELIIDCYKHSFFNPNNYQQHQKTVAVCRAGNVIGGGDWAADRLIPDIVRSVIVGKDISIRNPTSVRPWQHVLEPLCGYLLLGDFLSKQSGYREGIFNFGPYTEDTLPVKDVVTLAISCWGRGTYTVSNSFDQPHEANMLKLDISKAMTELNWKPRLNADYAIKLTVDWYKTFFNKPTDIIEFTESQIANYLL